MHGHEILKTFTIAASLGVCLTMVASYFRTSAIVVLLIGGVMAGPQALGLVHPEVLGEGLGTIISLAVAIILFEGGLTLDLKGYRTVGREIISILTIGVLVTWLGTTVLLKLVFDFQWPFCFLAASLVIVTGPTVIGPLLHRINVTKKLHHILHWEGVLIDPIGVFIALLSYEFFVSTGAGHESPLQDFLLRFTVGALVGVTFGFLLHWILNRGWIDKGHTNIFVLAMAMLNFAIADMVIAECGLLSVTIAGLVLGSQKSTQLRDIVSYKVELKDFLIGLLFILLAANLDLYSFVQYGWKLVLVVVAIMLLVRPLNVFLSLHRSSMNNSEKLFLSWIAPRGIVAASMASVFALELSHRDASQGQFLETFTYSVIAGTVMVQGLTAGMVARWLGVVRPASDGWVIVGAHALGRRIAEFFAAEKIDVVLVDTNPREVRTARREGLEAINDDAMLMNQDNYPSLYGCGNLLAITANQDLNRMVCRRWAELLDGKGLFRWEQTGYENDENRHLLVGKSVWGDLPLSRWMQPDCEAAPLFVRKHPADLSPDEENVLLTSRGDATLLIGELEEYSDGDRSLIYNLRRGQYECSLPLTPFNVTDSEQTELYDLYNEMLNHLHVQSFELDPETTLADIWKREQQHTSLLGHGIAMPHYWSPHIERSVLMVTRPQSPVVCPQTQRPIELVFLLLSPKENPKAHLEHLSYIAKLIGSESRRQRMFDAEDSGELYKMIVSS
jgi:NhaP-type Na+/H+ or K+/H+ antiporter/mannitol/fructose-specific phosphotransferase system IIA component (Ntr-type)